MDIGAIGADRIQSMMAQLKAAATKPAGPVSPAGLGGLNGPGQAGATPKLDFGAALKSTLDGVSAAQTKAADMGKAFSMGDESVSLSDVMISMQKSSINFQATIQARNKLVSAYQEIMNMQV
jgi:flagellar hook-basal body complex protein FliE